MMMMMIIFISIIFSVAPICASTQNGPSWTKVQVYHYYDDDSDGYGDGYDDSFADVDDDDDWGDDEDVDDVCANLQACRFENHIAKCASSVFS